MAYAKDTSVSVDVTQMEIKRTLKRAGATAIVDGWFGDRATVAFEMSGRRVRFDLTMPEQREFRTTDGGKARTDAAMEKAYQQALRSRWRGLLLVIKAKLEAIESGIVSFDQEFLAHISLPTGETVGERTIPQIADAYAGRPMPPLLPPPRGEGEA